MRLAGLSIFVTVLTVFVLYSIVADHGWIMPPANDHFARILILATAVFMIGLMDDLVRVHVLMSMMQRRRLQA